VARKEQLSYQGFLDELLLAESHDTDRGSSVRRVRSANFPRDKWLGGFDYDANPNINSSRSAPWAPQPRSRLPDPVHLGHGLRSSSWKPKTRKSSPRPWPRYGRVNLLCIDELGYMELDKEERSSSSSSSRKGKRKRPWPSQRTHPYPAECLRGPSGAQSGLNLVDNHTAASVTRQQLQERPGGQDIGVLVVHVEQVYAVVKPGAVKYSVLHYGHVKAVGICIDYRGPHAP
jgi:hypothetical protein